MLQSKSNYNVISQNKNSQESFLIDLSEFFRNKVLYYKKKTQLQDPINYNNAISVTSFIPRSIYGYHNLISTNISNENMNAILYIPI